MTSVNNGPFIRTADKLLYHLFVFRPAVAVSRNTSAAAEIHPALFLFDKAYQHGTVERLPVEIAEHAGIISARFPFGLPDDAERGGFRGPRYRTCGKHIEKDVAHPRLVPGRQAAGYLGTHLQDVAAACGDTVDVAEPLHMYPVGMDAQVVPQQIHDGIVFGGLLRVIQYRLPGIGHGSIDGAFHRIGSDTTAGDTHETFRRKQTNRPGT